MVHSECLQRLRLAGIVRDHRLRLDVVVVGSQRRRHDGLRLDTARLGEIENAANKTEYKLQLTQSGISLHTKNAVQRKTDSQDTMAMWKGGKTSKPLQPILHRNFFRKKNLAPSTGFNKI